MRVPTQLVASAVLLASAALSNVIIPRQGTPGEAGDRRLLKAETYQLIEQVMATFHIPGAVVAITTPNGDEVISLGVRDAVGTPVGSDTYWAIASNSKLITAVTIATLAEQGIRLANGQPFTLETRLLDIDPDFRMVNDTATREATVLDFMTHQSGLPGHNLALTPEDTAQVAFDRLDQLKANLGFRERFQYTNIGFVVATHVVEKVTGRSFYDVADEIVFQPLGMNATWDATEAMTSGRLSQGFTKSGINSTQCVIDSLAAPGTNTTTVAESCLGRVESFKFWTDGKGQDWGGGGAAILSGDDMIIWAKELLNPSKLSAGVIERVQTGVIPVAPVSDMPEGDPNTFMPEVALGTITIPYRGYNLSQHDGALPGSNSLFTRIRNESIGVFIACNDDIYSSPFASATTQTVIDELLGLAPVDHFLGPLGAGGLATGVQISEPSVSDPRPAPEGYVGHTYKAPGYPAFALEPLDLADTEAARRAGLPLEYFLADIVDMLPISIAGGPTYWARYPSTFASHMIITHWDGPLFNCTTMLSWNRDDGGDGGGYASQEQGGEEGVSPLVAKYTGGGPCVFGEDGIGIFGNVWTQNSQLPLPEPVETDIRASAPVFFGRE